MNLKWKRLIVVASIFALSALIFGSALVYSAPKSQSVPLDAVADYTDVELTGGWRAVLIPVQGYREITIYVSQLAGPLSTGLYGTVQSVLRIDGVPDMYAPADSFEYDGTSLGKTYEVASNYVAVTVAHEFATETNPAQIRIAWYLTE